MAKPNWKNRTLVKCDNLEFLRSMNSNSVDLIATDPPFNKGRDFHATPDSLAKGASFQDRWSWEKDVHDDWIDKLQDDFPKVLNVINGSRNSYGDDMGAFLCFMAVRILEMHRVLKDTGSMYLHCDHTASHYLKELMDSIFGRENFKNEIIWERSHSRSSISKNFRNAHDTILRYSKSKEFCFNIQYKELSEASKKIYSKKDDKGFFRLVPLLVSGKRNGETGKSWRGINPNNFGNSGMHWVTKHENLEKYDHAKLIVWPKKEGGAPNLKYYLHQNKGVPINTVWTEVGIIESSSLESMDYPTQKPLALYERIIKASSNEGDIVLDPFCGCATTCVAAEKLGRQWIGIDIWEKAHTLVIDRLKKEGSLSSSKDKRHDLLITKGEVIYIKKTLKRTDGGDIAVPFLQTKIKQFDDREKDPHTNPQKKIMLLDQHGPFCQGCGFGGEGFDERYFELDHRYPRSEGGSNLIQNRILLCGPCNKLKRDWYTLGWLRIENKKRGYMKNEAVLMNLRA